MATINESRYAAFDDGLINGNLSKNQELYLHDSVVTANKIMKIITSRKDLDIEQIEYATKLDKNTCKIYCRWLKSKGLIDIVGNRRK